MQKLSGRRLTDTPWDVPPVPCNCGLSLNREETLSEAGLTTPDNSPEAVLTSPSGREKRSFILTPVYVLNRNGKPLMPCHPAKARLLLKQGKARVVRRTPFTIQLLYGSSGYRQPVTVGVDSGYKITGVSVVSGKKELFAGEFHLRTDIQRLLSERRQYRRFRRYRKWYRKARFLNRKKPADWLPPSVQHRFDSHIKIVNWISKFIPVSRVVVEVARFDIHKIKNPEVKGVGYQNGDMKGFYNVREYVLWRDNYQCQCCKGKSKDRRLEIHHIVTRQTGSDRPYNLITLCKTCHRLVTQGKIQLKIKSVKHYKAESFMTTVRWKLIDKLKEISGYENVTHTYGYLTRYTREQLGLVKSHVNDAFVIAGGTTQNRTVDYFFVKQVRKCNRKLTKGIRSHIKNVAERLIFGLQRFDKVLWKGIECFISGRRKTGYFDIRTLDGKKIHASAKHTELTLLERAKTFLVERRKRVLLPSLTEGVSEPVRIR